MKKYHLRYDCYNSVTKFIEIKTILYFVATIVFLFALACDGGGGGGRTNPTRQFYPFEDVKTDSLENILGKTVELFGYTSDSCKLIVVEDIGDDYNVVPIKIEGDPERRGVYLTRLKLEKTTDKSLYSVYEDFDPLSKTGDMKVMKVPDLASEKTLVEGIEDFPQSETCDGYKNYINNQNVTYISTPNSSSSTSTNSNNTTTQSATYSWYANPWGTCDEGTLTQTRTIYCKAYDGSQVADSYCTEAQTSSTNQSCIEMSLKLVEGGTFTMGPDTDSFTDNPAHQVTITNNFDIGIYEVKNNEVVQVYNWAKKNNVSNLVFTSTSVTYNGNEILDLDSSSSQIAYNSSDGYLYVKVGKELFPCVNINKYGADAFVEFLNQQKQINKYRLLTEAEWEYAARGGGTEPPNNYTYSGSNTTIDDVAWYDGNSGGVTHTVGTKSPNELGLYDMSGNVLEWVADYYSANYYSISPTNDPLNTTVNIYFVLRGGSYTHSDSYCSVVSRFANQPNTSAAYIGFRIAKSL